MAITIKSIAIPTKERKISAEMLALSKALTKLIKTAIVNAPPTGPYGSIKTQSVSKNSKLVRTAAVGYTQDPDLKLTMFLQSYAINVNDGRKPYPNRGVKFNGGFFTAILQWVKAKGLQTKFKGARGRFITNNAIAFIICRSINKKGVKKRLFLDTAENIMNRGLEYFIDNNLATIIFEDLSQNLQKI